MHFCHNSKIEYDNRVSTLHSLVKILPMVITLGFMFKYIVPIICSWAFILGMTEYILKNAKLHC